MAGRRTNLALRVLLPASVATGALTFLVGSGPVLLVVVTHGVVALGLLVLLPWKQSIARRGLARRRRDRWLSLTLTAMVLLALVSGLAHSTGLLLSAGPLTAMQVHVGVAVVALLAGLAHARRRRTRARSGDLSRRTVVRAGLGVAVASVGYAALDGTASALSLPGAQRRATGSYEQGSGIPSAMPTTSWLFDTVPDDDPSTWQLAVASGAARQTLALNRLREYDDELTAVLDCTGGWWAEQRWRGVRVTRLLPPGATGSVLVVSATGYRRRLPLSDDLLLAVDVGGAPLSRGHGGPLRLVVPGRRGFHWVKWVTRIEHDDQPWWLQAPLPLR